MSKILDRSGLGASISAVQNDANLDSLSGINEAQAGTTYTVDIDDQNNTIELSNVSPIAVTLTAIATIAAALHTSDFKVTLKNIGAGLVTITRGSTDTFDGGATTKDLKQDEYITIQTDSTQAIWNVISYSRASTAAELTGNIVDSNGNEVLIPATTASAVNEVTITNAATGDQAKIQGTGEAAGAGLIIEGTGTDSSVDVNSTGTGAVNLNNEPIHVRAFCEATKLTASSELNNTVITLDTATYDPLSDFSGSVYTPGIAGHYLVSCNISGSTASLTSLKVQIRKNGTAVREVQATNTYGSPAFMQVSGTVIVSMNGTTDYIDLYNTSGQTQTMNGGIHRGLTVCRIDRLNS